MPSSPRNTLATHFRTLHKPGSPLLLTNIWDAMTASTIASLPLTSALATASFAIAAAAGLADADLDLATNLRAVEGIARVAAKHNLPLTVDFQDGFGEELEDGAKRLLEMGVVGINLEDYGREKEGLYSVSEQCERISDVMRVAREAGVPNLVVNARTDSLFMGRSLDEAIARGKAYLAAGAFSVFIWGGPSRQGWIRSEVKKAADALEGKLDVILVHEKQGGLSVREIAELGVARISVGPALMRWSAERIGEEAGRILESKEAREVY